MWARFTDEAKKSVLQAQEEASQVGDQYVSTEHLLLGLLRQPDSVACRVLMTTGLSLDQIRGDIAKQLPPGTPRGAEDISLTPRGKRVIDLAYQESIDLGDSFIGTEHLLLGVVGEVEGLAGGFLAKLGFTLESTRELIALQRKGEG